MLESILEILNSSFFPTVVVASFMAYLTYRQQRAGQRDTKDMQEKANAVSETHNAMLAYKELYETEHAKRLEIDDELKDCRRLVRQDFDDAVKGMRESPIKEPNPRKGQS